MKLYFQVVSGSVWHVVHEYGFCGYFGLISRACCGVPFLPIGKTYERKNKDMVLCKKCETISSKTTEKPKRKVNHEQRTDC
jgi:hypothetical protein